MVEVAAHPVADKVLTRFTTPVAAVTADPVIAAVNSSAGKHTGSLAVATEKSLPLRPLPARLSAGATESATFETGASGRLLKVALICAWQLVSPHAGLRSVDVVVWPTRRRITPLGEGLVAVGLTSIPSQGSGDLLIR